MDLSVETITVGLLQANSYLLSSKKDLALIDPGGDGDKIISRIKSKKANLKYILATHGHIDHVAALNELSEAFPKAKIFFPERDANYHEYDESSTVNNVIFPGFKKKHADLREGLKIKLGEKILRVIETPGHTPGSVCFLVDNLLFSGDTLFFRALGSTQLPGGNEVDLKKSLKKLKALPPETKVFPGHLAPTTIGMEIEAKML